MTMLAIPKENLAAELLRIVSQAEPTSHGKPVAVVLMGGVAAGKTTLRKQNYGTGYVVIDAADIFLGLSPEQNLDFPDALLGPMEQVGSAVALKALSENRSVVTEIIGADQDKTAELIEALKSIGYEVRVVGVTCDVDEAFTRNMSRGPDNISAYYAERFQINWIIAACQKLQSQERSGATPIQTHVSVPVQRIYEDSDYLLFKKNGIFGIRHPFFSSFHIQLKSREMVVAVTGREKRFLLAVVGEMARLGHSPQKIKDSSVFRDFSEAVGTGGQARWQLFFAHSTAKELANHYVST